MNLLQSFHKLCLIYSRKLPGELKGFCSYKISRLKVKDAQGLLYNSFEKELNSNSNMCIKDLSLVLLRSIGILYSILMEAGHI